MGLILSVDTFSSRTAYRLYYRAATSNNLRLESCFHEVAEITRGPARLRLRFFRLSQP